MAKSFKILRDKMSAERRIRNRQKTDILLAGITIQELRKEIGKTQEQVAHILEKSQESISKLEKQPDMYVSTLSEYIKALGGELNLLVSLPDREIRLKLPRDSEQASV